MNWYPCKECGKSHPFEVTAAHPCPLQPKGNSQAKKQRAQPKAPRKTVEANAPDPAVPIKRKRAPAGTFDRKAYQRDLMRKRRAAAKKAMTK